jgi:hypothetical protein
MNRAAVAAEVVFLPPEEGGRQQPPVLGIPATYRPHLVVQDRSARQAIVREGNVIDEPYLAVTFADGPPALQFGEAARFTLRLDYHPQVDYAALCVGATFTVREGGRVVSHGVVLERLDAG